MTKRYSIASARDNLASIVHDLESIDSVEITRRGEPVAILLSKSHYDRLTACKTGFWEAYTQFIKEVNLVDLKIDPDDVFGNIRDQSAGREIKL
jgi:prevent-host-death family protein